MELGDGCKDVVDEFAAGCGGVDAFGHRPELNVLIVETGEQIGKVQN